MHWQISRTYHSYLTTDNRRVQGDRQYNRTMQGYVKGLKSYILGADKNLKVI